jgi:hypothetical protein
MKEGRYSAQARQVLLGVGLQAAAVVMGSLLFTRLVCLELTEATKTIIRHLTIALIQTHKKTTRKTAVVKV